MGETTYIKRPSDQEQKEFNDRAARLLKGASRDQLIKALADTALALVHRTVDTSNEELAAMLAMRFVVEALEGAS